MHTHTHRHSTVRLLLAVAGLLTLLLATPVLARTSTPPRPTSTAQSSRAAPDNAARYLILFVADGWGPNHIAAANSYSGDAPAYQAWPRRWLSTYPANGDYDPARAWTEFDYVNHGYTDSAAAATALYTGVKTQNGRIDVTVESGQRLTAISEEARVLGMATGAVSTVYISHATPGAWSAHNDARGNGFAISDEMLWGDPHTTGSDAPGYAGGHGLTLPPLDVAIGAGHPHWKGGLYVNQAIRDKLAAESGAPGAFTFVERITGSADGGERLLGLAQMAGVTRLVGLFGGAGGNIEYRRADGAGHDPENPTLAEMSAAALAVLARDPEGFALMIEGGAVDWGAHKNDMDRMVGEMIGFNQAVQVVIDWVEDESNGSSWRNTLIIITGDHETGYLTAGPQQFPDRPLGPINRATLALEKEIAGSGRRASWDDANGNAEIDAGETVYWAWNSGIHTNTLIPLYAKGVGAGRFDDDISGVDPVRGPYLDNTAVRQAMDVLLEAPLDPLWLPLVYTTRLPAPDVDAPPVQALAPPLFAISPQTSSPAMPAGPESVLATPTFEDDIAALVNQERWDNGNLPPLKHESILHSVAHDHSVDMAEDDYVMHCDPDTGLEP